jgi:hypothetical protein
MLKTFKKYFIPHKENNHKPHILRNASIALFLGIVLVAEIGYLSATLIIIPRISGVAAVIASNVVDGTNQNRQANNLPALATNPLLVAAAQAKASDMATKGYFAHNSPDGKTPWDWLTAENYPYVYAGENLAVNFYDSQAVVDAWMNSPEHRANILNSHYTDIGIASAEGIYQGSHALFIVQFFGSTANSNSTSTATSSIASSTLSTQSVLFSSPASLVNAVRDLPFANSSQVIDLVYFIIFTLIFLSLIFAIFIKINVQHPKLIATAVLLLIVIIILVGFNREIASAFGSIQ